MQERQFLQAKKEKMPKVDYDSSLLPDKMV